MPVQLPSLPTDLRVKVRHAAIKILQENPVLKVVKCWQIGDGSETDKLPYSPSLLPWVRIRPYSTVMTQVAQQERMHGYAIYIEIATPGTNWDDFENLWGAIEDTFKKDAKFGETTVFKYLQTIGGNRGAIDVYVEQDAIRDLADLNRQVIGRYGSGIIMIPFLKRS